MSRHDPYDGDIDPDRCRDHPRPGRPRRRMKRRGSPAVVLLIIAAVLVGVVGITVVLVVGLRDRGWLGKAAQGPSGPADQFIDRLVGEWEGEDLDGKVSFQLRKDHTATLTTSRQVDQFTWEPESTEGNSLVIRTSAGQGGTGRTRFVLLSANEVRLESLKVNKAIILTRKG
jgi:hypothetical protein